MSRIVNRQGMMDIIWGSTLMGGGGGGSIRAGVQLLESFEKHHPEIPMEVEMVSVDEMEDHAFAASGTGLGAPAAIVKVDFSQYASNTFKVLEELCSKNSIKLKYNYAVELGGFSSFFPFLLALQTGKPAVDADGSGRAVPAIQTLLLNVNDCPCSPFGLANGKNDKIAVELADPCDAVLAEHISRDIAGMFGNMVGIYGWPIDKNMMKEKVCCGTMTLTEEIGKCLRTSNAADSDMFEELTCRGIIDAKVICKGTIQDIVTETRNGFDFGTLIVKSDKTGETYYIRYQNENLLLQKKVGDGFQDLLTVPDLIAMYCIDPNGDKDACPRMPLSNADAKVGMKIAVGAIRVDAKWFINGTKWWDVWAECMDNMGYTGGHLGFDQVTAQE